MMCAQISYLIDHSIDLMWLSCYCCRDVATCPALVSRSQTSIFSAGRYRLQYKRPH